MGVRTNQLAGSDLTDLTEVGASPALSQWVQFAPAYSSAFGTLETAELQPEIQGDFIYGINTQRWITAKSGTGAEVDTNGGRLRLQAGTDATSYAYIISRRPVRYRAGQGTTARFTPVFGTPKATNLQLWGMGTIASNAPFCGYYVAMQGTAVSLAHYIGGTPTFIPRADWNGDKLDGTGTSGVTWTPTYGSPWMIKYPYLGYGDIFFYMQHPTSGAWILVHTIRYANTTAAVQLSNPALSFVGYTANSGNTTNVTMYCGSVGVFVSGPRTFTSSVKWAADATKATVSTEAAVLHIRNATSYNGLTNRGLIRLGSISYGASGNSYGQLRLKIGATLGGTPSWTAVNGTTADAGVTITAGNSIASYDSAGTYTSGGTYIWNCALASGQSFVDLIPYEIFIAPTEILTVTASFAAASNISVSLNWAEDI